MSAELHKHDFKIDLVPAEAFQLLKPEYTGDGWRLFLWPDDKGDLKEWIGKTVLFTCLGDPISLAKILDVLAPGDECNTATTSWCIEILFDDYKPIDRPTIGYSKRRLSYDPNAYRGTAMEIGFAAEWQRENMREHSHKSIGLLQFLMLQESQEPENKGLEPWVTDRERRIVATVVQWLGTNVGRGFIHAAMARAGLKVSDI